MAPRVFVEFEKLKFQDLSLQMNILNIFKQWSKRLQ